MSKLSIKEIQLNFCDVLNKYFHSKGYKLFNESNTSIFVRKNENIAIHFFFNFFSNYTIGVSPLFISFYEVEDYLLDIGIPDQGLTEYKKKEKLNLPTIEFNHIPDDLSNKTILTTIDVNEIANKFISFYTNEGLTFISQYSNLIEIYNDLPGIPKWKNLICGMGDAYIRGLIISKLCNDPLFEKKLETIDQMIQNADNWTPYWKKYKTTLKKIEPKYNT